MYQRFLKARYVSMCGATSLATFLLFLTIALLQDLSNVWSLPFVGGFDLIRALFFLYLNPFIHMYAWTFVAIVVISLLLGMYCTLLLYIKDYRRGKITHKKPLRAPGIISGIFVSLGMGCAACGSIVLLSIATSFGFGLSVFVISWVSSAFMVLAIVILIYSNYRLYQQTLNPLVCRI